MPPKRRAKVIDLTADDAPASSSQGYAESQPSPRATKQARTSRNNAQRAPPGSSQDAPIFVDEDEDDEEEDDASQEAPNSTQGYSQQHYNYLLYGSLDNKIVGVRYYNGYATTGETVVLRREPHNQYDSNAIRVDNVQGEQIGHIPRLLAAKLAKYMDDRSLLIEAQLTGEKGYYECPIELHLYGTDDPVMRQELMSKMKKDRLPVGQASERQRREAAARKEQERRAKGASKKGKKGIQPLQDTENSMAEYAANLAQGDPSMTGPSLEDIISGSERFNPRNMDEIVEEFGVKEEDLAAMPQAPQPEALLTELHPFQLQGLQWMLDKESPKLPSPGTQDTVQLWRPHTHISNVYTNVATSFSTKKPALASGGILADDMGLGKTIQTISLIVADRALGRGAKDASGATLILAPVSVMSNWSTQMKNHIKPEHALRIMFWHGQRKEPITPQTINNYDVVISTYESISSDWYSQKSTALPRKAGPFSVKWRRVILDEGHNIRNPKAKKTIAISNLMAQSRWTLTGTPIINNLKDLYSQVRFLRLSGGLDSFEVFHSAIMRPVMQGDARGQKSLQMLMSDICLRRKKEMGFIDLRLPQLYEYVHKVKLHAHEQEKYNVLEAEAKGQLDEYRKSIGKKNAASTYRHLLEVLLRMRQVCNHWQLVGKERLDSIIEQLQEDGAVDLTEENKVALQKMLQLSIDSQEDCPICLDIYKEPVITRCAHIFCTACIERVIETQHKCPMCRAELESLETTTVKPAKKKSTAPSAPLTQEQIADKASLEKNTSTKVEALFDILKASAQDPTNKTIIFSQWTSFLDILEPHLAAHGFKYVRIDGSMSTARRDTALEALDSDPKTTVMLASLAVCSVGLNLVAANQVIMADSWWAPAIEDQAVDRVHRLGQKRETKVFRLVVEGSVEERVLGIQEEKRKLMGLAFAEKEGGKQRKRAGAGLGDLMRLLGTQQQASQEEGEN
ncbi:Putative SWI/SNF-related matrix-associated actin-dependent regulator of chromatin subfamily A member 3-like 1 [Curvularia clavata]|uniref:SWI/SNF-related matrix-associated actin-dependent regulator of chromatin subfamily A member 3-like 1 n=1 Tax=Curvularia clavata TaxID=95742 RepID=A0A9Q9DTD9_CURCL|nr:Putative SWI/SNF-related matrix-associated actin-dependent regulator of chromatin subfamily A member 3-like 1 [Curvularia clavata]